jgi:hypothetical protein
MGRLADPSHGFLLTVMLLLIEPYRDAAVEPPVSLQPR